MKYKYNGQWVDVNIKALDSMEIGSIIAFAGDTIPTGWLVCDGSSITQSAYPELYALIGGTLPDFRGRVLVGQNTSDNDFDTLLETGGYKGLQKHTHQSVELGGNTMTSWSSTGSGGVFNLESLFQSNQFNNNQVNTGNVNGNATDNGAPSTATNGNLQPYAVINWIIKATNTTPTMASVVNATNNSTTDTYSCEYSNEHYGGVVLYDGNGSSTEITLNDTTANYSYIEIFGNTNGNWASIKIPNSNGKTFEPSIRYLAGSQIVFILATYNINGNKITPDTTKCGYATINNMGVANFNYDQTNYFYITRVVGYK